MKAPADRTAKRISAAEWRAGHDGAARLQQKPPKRPRSMPIPADRIAVRA